MKTPVRRAAFLLLCGLALCLRTWQAQLVFQGQQKVFPESQKGLFRAWVAEEPEILFTRQPESHDTGRLNGAYQPFVREVRAVCVVCSRDGKNIPPVKARCAFLLSPQVPQPVVSYGEAVEIQGKIQSPSPALNPGQFDYAHYLRTKGVAYVMYVAPGKWRKIPPSFSEEPSPLGGEGRVRGAAFSSPPTLTPSLSLSGRGGRGYGWTFLRWSCGLKRKAEEAIYRYLPNPENALLDGILLGERSPLPEEMVESFFLTGTIHILAVSGMITAFLAGLLFMVFRALQFNRKWAAGMTLVALTFFVFMTGAHPPVCRAGLFSAMALLAVLLERRIHGGTLLMATAVLLTAWNPFVLEDLSFQISFLATAGLMVMAPWFMEKLSFLWKPAALLITASTAAQLAVWCLVIYDFNQLSVYSILANLVIVPVTLFSTAAGLALLAGALVHPALGTLFGAACEAPLKLLIILADGMAKLPKAEWIVASPPLGWALVFHALLLFTFLCFWPSRQPENPSEDWKKGREVVERGRRLAVGGWVLFLGGTGLALLVSALRPQPFRATFLAVGHGNAVVLRSPEGRVLVVDAGKETRGPDRYLPLVAYLRHIGAQRVDGALNTHPDEDHVGGLVNVVSAYPVSVAFEGSKAKSDSVIYRQFKETLQRRGVPLVPLKGGDRIGALGPVQVEILHPSAKYDPPFHPDNNLSVVSLVSFGGFNLVLPGDLEKDGLLQLLKNHRPFPKVDWLMAPHHGRSSGEPALCAKGFHPHFVVFSDWKDYPDSRAAYQTVRSDSVVLATSQVGAVEVEMTPTGEGRYRTFQDKKWIHFGVNQ